MKPLLKFEGITKSFSGNIANNNIDLEIYKGEIHALIGENGAGKSTLMNILYGLIQPDAGRIYLNGKVLRLNSPNVAIRNGIGMVFQHFMLIPSLTVCENIVLGMEPKKGIFIDQKKAIKDVKKISQQFGLNIDVTEKVENLNVGIQQKVEIIKTLYRGAEIIVLDEPTAILTLQETEELFKTLKSLTAEGKTIILITHKLREVMAISDRITVLQQGKVKGNVLVGDTNEAALAKMMVGREVILKVDKDPLTPGCEKCKVENIVCKKNAEVNAIDDICLTLKEGHILGLAGVEGNGQTELFEVLSGLEKADKGKVLINEQENQIDIFNLPAHKIRKYPIAIVHEDRHKRGLILDYSVAENLILGRHRNKQFSKWGFIRKKNIEKYADEMIKKYDIRVSSREQKARNLSGGNQQKVIIARELDFNPEILLISQPTRGVDIGSIEFIHKKIIENREQMKAILLISAELSEIMSLSDTIGVLYGGKIIEYIPSVEATEEKLGLLMTGAHHVKAVKEEFNHE
ncbi:MAG: ABC transporter ATP-binding protein [Clostridia bacterium]|jgi:simple sugar transport system ATP-binding protein|nr:ABC transporter ATP-binding protein [Clostridia bacterium]